MKSGIACGVLLLSILLSGPALATTDNGKKDFVSFRSDNEQEYLNAYRAQYMKLASAYKTGNPDVRKSSGIETFLAKAEVVLKGWAEAPALKRYVAKAKALVGIKTVVPSTPAIFYTLNTSGLPPVVGLRMAPIDDPDNQLNSIVWEFGDSTSVTIPAVEFLNDPSREMQHVYPTAARYTVKLKLYDHAGNFTEKQVYVWSRNNRVPVPKFDYTTNVGGNPLAVSFQSLATDTDGTIGHYYWQFGDGTGADGATMSTTSHTYSAPGVYDVFAAASDDDQGTKFITTKIYVGVPAPQNRKAPVAIARINKSYGNAPLTVNFNSLDSYSLSGEIASREWDFGDFTSPFNYSRNTAVNYTFYRPGTYFGSVKVTDDAGLESREYFEIHVVDPAITESPTVYAYNRGGRNFQFESNPYALRVPAIPGYTFWDFGDATYGRGPFANHQYATDGTYNVGLKIYDLRGGVSFAGRSITVSPNPTIPVAQFQSNRMGNDPSSFVFLSQQLDQIAPTTTATWDFGDGAKHVGLHMNVLNVTHTYSSPGVYTAALTTTTAAGISNTQTQSIVVNPPGLDIRAVIKLGSNFGEVPLPVRFDAKSSSSSAGPIAKYFWTINSDAGPVRFTNPLFIQTFQTGGTRFVQLAVVDSSGNAAINSDRVVAIDPSQIPGNNRPPIPRISISFPDPSNPGLFRFGAGGSSDPDGDEIINYRWIVDSQEIDEHNESITRQIATFGKHRVGLRITDKWGRMGETSIEFTRGSTTEVLIDFAVAPLRATVNSKVTFIADAEHFLVPGAVPKDFQWDFGDGNTDCCFERVSTFYTSAGTYNVTLTVKGSDGLTYRHTKSVVIESVMSPSIIIRASDLEGSHEAISGGTIYSREFPFSVKFDVMALSSAQGQIIDASWDFGDGNSGFGTSPTWTFHKPGIYQVEVEGKDSQGQTGVSSITVAVGDSNCSEADGTTCLTLPTTDGNVIRIGDPEWVLRHDQGNAAWTPGGPGWISLTTLDEVEPQVIDISSAVTIAGNNLSISNSGLDALGVNFSKSYRIDVASQLDPDFSYSGTWPEIIFGVRSLTVSSHEPNVTLELVGTSSGFRRYIDLGSSTTITISNLPPDLFSLHASKGGRSRDYSADLSNGPVDMDIDLSDQAIAAERAAWKNIQFEPKDVFRGRREYQVKMKRYQELQSSTSADDYCSDNRQFTNSVIRETSPDIDYSFGFDMSLPNVRADFFNVGPEFGGSLRMSCDIEAAVAGIGFWKWWYVDKPLRCGLPTDYHPEYYAQLRSDLGWQLTAPVRILYEVRDRNSGQSVKGEINWTIAKVLQKWGTDIDTAFERFGHFPAPVGHEWGFRFNEEIPVPRDFVRPEASIRLVMPSQWAPGAFFHTFCDIERYQPERAYITKIFTKDISTGSVTSANEFFSSISNSPADNGLRAISNKLFPLDQDPYVGSPQAAAPNLFSAQFWGRINKGSFDDDDFTNVDVRFEYNGQSATRSYAISEKKSLPKNEMDVAFTIPISSIENVFAYSPNPASRLKVTASLKGQIVQIVSNENVAYFTPTFNVKKMSPNPAQYFNNNNVCSAGFYSTERISAFATPKMIEALKAADSEVGALRCNDMSLPWGGEFKLPGWTAHESHTKGETADVRYFFNGTIEERDLYDSDVRRLDVIDYMNFSNSILNITSQPGPGEGISWADRNDIFDFCMNNGSPLAPCAAAMTVFDLSFEKALEICQRYLTVTGEPLLLSCTRGGGSYINSIKRMSDWIATNTPKLKQMGTRFTKVLMSNGRLPPLVPGTFPYQGGNWQERLMNLGVWPDSQMVWQLGPDGTLIKDKVLPCHNTAEVGCKLRTFFTNPAHYSHFHLAL